MKEVTVKRNTKETQITLTLSLREPGPSSIETPLGFLNHMLNAMAFHGGFRMTLTAEGDVEVDDHHLTEDIGLVLGEALEKYRAAAGPLTRFGHQIIPMDEALSEVTVDVCGRPTPVLLADFPQERCGTFDTALIREFWKALAGRARISLHGRCRYGDNSHHMAEALFKALGRALGQAYEPQDTLAGASGAQELSTKGTLSV